MREVHALVERVRQTDGALGRVCREVVTSMHVPQVDRLASFAQDDTDTHTQRRAASLQRCVLTGLHSARCLDVSRAWKTERPLYVHERFEYFVVMLYYVHRLEHVVRSAAKTWLAERDDGGSLDDLARAWGGETALFRDMWRRFAEGHAHVKASLEQWLLCA